jgi:acyl-CoA dehydrogenase
MNFEYSEKSLDLQEKLKLFMEQNIYPLESDYRQFTHKHKWQIFPEMETLKEKAKEKKLWNLFLPKTYGAFSPGLTNLEYAPLAEIMGRVLWSSQVFNCSAPDTGNMEVLCKYGSDAQKDKWLLPLLNGQTRSAFLMTEPQVASSDARNIECRIKKDGDSYLVNGHKWWSTGALNPNTSFFIVMGKTNPAADSFRQQSMLIVPKNTEGVKILRPLQLYGYMDSPEGHAEILLDNVRVPLDNIILNEGAGFEIAQGRLGPGRIHHCMRLIGTAQRAFEMMCKRVNSREAFGKKISSFSGVKQDIADLKCKIEQARLLTLAAADKIDKQGVKKAKDLISMIKIVVPNMACKVIDQSIQMHGGQGVSQDTPLAEFWSYARALRIADGPDEVHRHQLGRNILNAFKQ